jgi:hypothetical protein
VKYECLSGKTCSLFKIRFFRRAETRRIDRVSRRLYNELIRSARAGLHQGDRSPAIAWRSAFRRSRIHQPRTTEAKRLLWSVMAKGSFFEYSERGHARPEGKE